MRMRRYASVQGRIDHGRIACAVQSATGVIIDGHDRPFFMKEI